MATGVTLPVGVDVTGGLSLVSGDDNSIKIIKTALGDNDNDNAFQQDIGLGADIVFALDKPDSRAQIVRRLRVIFADFERQNRYRLLRDTVKFIEAPGTGELTLEFRYLDLETDEPKTFSQVITGTGTGIGT